MKRHFGKNTFNFMLAGTIALTPVAANLMMVTSTAQAAESNALISINSDFYTYLTPANIAAVTAAYNKISDDKIASVLGNDIIAKIDSKTADGTAVKLVSDFAKLQYQTNLTDFNNALNKFHADYKDDFDKIFAGKLSVDQSIALFKAFKQNLEEELVLSFTGSSTFDGVVEAAINDTLQEYPEYDGLFSEQLGLSIKDLLNLRTNLEKAVDPTLAASAAITSGFIRANGGDMEGYGTFTNGNPAVYYKLKVKGLEFDDHLVWKTDNSEIAYFPGNSNQLVSKKAGQVKIYAYYLNRPIFTTTVVTTPPDVSTFSNKDTVMKGKAASGSVITVKKGDTQVAVGNAASDGTFSIKMPHQNGGTVLSVTATSADTASIPKVIKVADKVAATPGVNPVGYRDTVISGTSEKYSTITVKSGRTTIATGTTSSNGTFSLKMKAQKKGTVLTVTSKDVAGNVSKAVTVKVVDKYAPATPSVNSVGYRDTVISGKAEDYSYITVKSGKTTITVGKTSSKGTFTLKMKAQKLGTVLTVTAKDAAGNVSNARTVKVVDKYAPYRPIVYTVDSRDTVIKGKAEANSIVIVKKGSKVLATGTASSNKNFSVKIPAQKAGTVLYVSAKDKAGNVGRSSKVIVRR